MTTQHERTAGAVGRETTAVKVVEGPRAECTATADGGLVFDLEPGDAADPRLLLKLRDKGDGAEERLVELPLTAVEGGHLRRAVLPADGEALAEGRWDAFVLDRPGDAVRRRVRSGLNDLRTLLGHRPPQGRPVAVRVPYRTKEGNLTVRAWLRQEHAEAGALQVREAAVTVRAELFNAVPGPGGAAVARCREQRGLTVESPVTALAGGGVSFSVDYGSLLDARPGAPCAWDLFVRPAEGAALVRVARLLDDVADRKQVFRYPARTVEGATVRPYYTISNELSLEVTV
ncbi:hypothetical protein GCM10027168_47560 [Streptomyces capparidis]